MEIISTEKAPAALGPYSQAIKANGSVWCSGQIPIDPTTGTIHAEGIEAQARQAIGFCQHTHIGILKNVLEAAGSGLDRVVKTTVFIRHMDDFAALNAVYAELFGASKPARSCVEVSCLPKGALLEIEAVAAL